MATKPAGLERAFIETVQTVSVKDTVSELAEIALDSVLDEGIARELPFVGALFKLHEGVLGIRERLFLKKVYKFLYEMHGISATERDKWADKLESDPKELFRFGEAVILLLDKLDQIEKATVLGKLARAHIEGLLTVEIWERLSSMVNRAYLSDLRMLPELQNEEVTGDVAQRLATTGLLSIVGLMEGEVKIALPKPDPDDPYNEEITNARIRVLRQVRIERVRGSVPIYRVNDDGHLLITYGLNP